MNNEKKWENVEEFINKKVVKPSLFLSDTLEVSQREGLPSINVQAPEGKLMSILVRSINAKRALEIGVLGGYSGLWILSGMKNGKLVGLEKSEKHARIANENFIRAGYGEDVNIIVCEALTSLNNMIKEHVQAFDFILIDADKKPYLHYFERAMELSHPGTIIYIDNMVWNGEIINSENESDDNAGIKRLYDHLEIEERVEATIIQTVGSKGYDGFAVLRVL